MSTNGLARGCDPQTSHDAAKDIAPKINLRCGQFLTGLRELGSATANEVAVHVAGGNIGEVGSIRRRASDLVRMGFIRVTDRRTCGVTGKPVSVYEMAESTKPPIEARMVESNDGDLLGFIRRVQPVSKLEIASELETLGRAGASWPRASQRHWLKEIDRLVSDGHLAETKDGKVLVAPEVPKVTDTQMMLF